jgi:hypothetical protein
MDTPSVDIRKMLILFSGEKLIFITHLRKKVDFFFYCNICRWIHFCRLKSASDWKNENHPAKTSLKKDLSIYTTFDPPLICCETPPLTKFIGVALYYCNCNKMLYINMKSENIWKLKKLSVSPLLILTFFMPKQYPQNFAGPLNVLWLRWDYSKIYKRALTTIFLKTIGQ